MIISLDSAKASHFHLSKSLRWWYNLITHSTRSWCASSYLICTYHQDIRTILIIRSICCFSVAVSSIVLTNYSSMFPLRWHTWPTIAIRYNIISAFIFFVSWIVWVWFLGVLRARRRFIFFIIATAYRMLIIVLAFTRWILNLDAPGMLISSHLPPTSQLQISRLQILFRILNISEPMTLQN